MTTGELAARPGAPDDTSDNGADTETGEDRAMEPATIVQLPAGGPGASVVVQGDRVVIERLVLADHDLAHFLASRDEEERAGLVERALKIGAVSARVIDARSIFVESFVWPALKANVMYENVYPLATALGRPLIAKLLVDVAQEEGATAVAHGCTGKGNDQVRFEVGIRTLDPSLDVLAPTRVWGLTREDCIEYAAKFDIPINVNKAKPYSIDENLVGRAIECGEMENLWAEPPADAAQDVANMLVEANIHAIVNFSPQVVTTPVGTTVRYVDFSMELQILVYHLINGTGPFGGGVLRTLGFTPPVPRPS